MDRTNLANLETLRPAGNRTPVTLFLDQNDHSDGPREVPDPYYEDNFPAVFDMLEDASRALLRKLA